MEPVKNFFYKWPRNFSLSLAVELLVAQPTARLVMTRLHRWQDKGRERLPEAAREERKTGMSK